MSEAVSQTQVGPEQHPVSLVVNDDLRRSRLTVFFRLLLVVPHLIWIALWGILASIVLLIAWIAALLTGRVPLALHDFLAAFIGYSTRVNAYLFLLANPWPTFSGKEPYPVSAHIEPPVSQGRLTVFFRIVLAIPALLLCYVFRAVNELVAFLSWFYVLAFGRMNEGMRNLSSWLYRYELQTTAYLYLLTPRYPSLAGVPAV